MATTFGWKKKIPNNLSKKRSAAFLENEEDPEESEAAEKQNARLLSKRLQSTAGFEDDQDTASQRLTDEGIAFAEQERFSDAIKKWNEALSLTPNEEKLHEMKSQVFLQLDKTFDAIKSAEKAVKLNPRWPTGHQALGRAQLKFGEFELAVKSFSRAFHLRPDDLELFKEDLMWSVKIREKARIHDSLLASKEKV